MVNVAVLGGAGGIGQPLSLLLKLNKRITELALYDIKNAPGVAADLSYINTPARVRAHTPEAGGLKAALEGAKLVIVVAGSAKLGDRIELPLDRDQLLSKNSPLCRDFANAIADNAPDAFILAVTNPINSTVPIFAEVLKERGVFDPRKLFGVTTLDAVRTSTFMAEKLGVPETVYVPVIGGHSRGTTIPLLSQARPHLDRPLSREASAQLTEAIQRGADAVIEAKERKGSATLSMAYATDALVKSILDAAVSDSGTTVSAYATAVSAYINLDADREGGATIKEAISRDLPYLAVPVELGPEGITRIPPLGPLSPYETELLQQAIPELEQSIAKGIQSARQV